MQEHLIPETPITAPTLTICLSSDEAHALIGDYENFFRVVEERLAQGKVLNSEELAIRRQLLERLRAQVDPIEMTAEEILAREG